MQRRSFVLAGTSLIAMPAFVHAQAVEKPKLTLAVGGKNLLYYLPLTIAESLGFFTAEGLEVTIADFAGGSRALQAMVERGYSANEIVHVLTSGKRTLSNPAFDLPPAKPLKSAAVGA